MSLDNYLQGQDNMSAPSCGPGSPKSPIGIRAVTNAVRSSRVWEEKTARTAMRRAKSAAEAGLSDEQLKKANIRGPNQMVMWELICRILETGQQVKELYSDKEDFFQARDSFGGALKSLQEERDSSIKSTEQILSMMEHFTQAQERHEQKIDQLLHDVERHNQRLNHLDNWRRGADEGADANGNQTMNMKIRMDRMQEEIHNLRAMKDDTDNLKRYKDESKAFAQSHQSSIAALQEDSRKLDERAKKIESSLAFMLQT